MAKRRFISLLPAYNQTADLTNFFASTVDEVFQPGTSESLSGYIGRVPSFFNPATDFYIGEPTTLRAFYQLESGMVSVDATTAITNALTYPDFVNHLSTDGANVFNHQRMFETEYYVWAPPINIDMITNFNDYYWFGDVSGITALPTLTLTAPMTVASGDGVTSRFALPPSMRSIPAQNEQPAVYVNDLPVTFVLDGADVVCYAPPPFGATVLVSRTPDLATALTGLVTANISDINANGVMFLSSSMRIRIVDALHIIGSWDAQPWDFTLWDDGGSDLYMVDGVGQGIRLTSQDRQIFGLPAQYVTIDRSSTQSNGWSDSNAWVHKASFAWSGQDFAGRKAVRPIIEFIRDMVLYPGSVWNGAADPLFMLYDLDNVPWNDPSTYPGSSFIGNKIFSFAVGTGPTDTVLARSVIFDANGYIVFQNDAYAVTAQFGGQAITSMAQFATIDRVTSYSALWRAASGTTQQTVSSGFYNVPLNLQANATTDDVVLISESTWLDHFQSIIGNQIGFSGLILGVNNYRDSLRDLSVGTAILQHRAPLLKAMLVSSDLSFDVPQAIRFIDLEYNRFRNKFIRRLTLLDNGGTLATVDPTVSPTIWVTAALKAITRDKNNNFPFALSPVGGGRYFIPATPTALGMLPAAIPAMVLDSTYGVPIQMIQGHDGSLTVAFNDWRDNVLLALEMLIYDNLPSQFQTEARPVFDIFHWIGNRTSIPVDGYSFQEFTTIIGPLFELWAQTNGLDYRSNTGYDETNSFTWNYNGVADIFGNPLPGNWRGIYKLYYGTDSPHTRPWEMLGFVSEPAWWVGSYGVPPYLPTNVMWADLQAGSIAGGPRQGIDPVYARPGLLQLLPVNAAGDLLDPANIGIINIAIPLAVASRPWQVGDLGPVEYLWTNTPSYRYALALASFLMKPARFMEECWDSLNIGYVGTQWVDIPTLARPLNSQQYVHGETMPNGSIAVVTGVQQWIADYLLSSGITSVGFGTAIRGLGVRLIHQMAGFVAKDNMKVLADNFGLLPEEDVNVILYTSPSISDEAYSGIIMEWTGAGWRAIGYDARDQFFTIIPPDPNGPKGVISLATATEPSIVIWRPNTYYPTSILASYQNSVYQCIKSHTSGLQFENNFWTPRPDLSTAMIRAPSVVTYARGLPTTQQVQYGTVFTNYQDVANFILGWQRWLVSRGWVFDGVDSSSGQILDWSLSVREFLVWAQVQWQPGNFIAMSPGQQGLKFITASGTILNVEDSTTGFFGLTNRSGAPIRQQDTNINRLDGQITIAGINTDIFFAQLEIASIEHALVFDNITIFDDVIYLPLFNMRQGRLRLVGCQRSTNWAGRLDAPGFVIMGDTLASDFEKTPNDVRYMFDIELADTKDLWTYARHNIGFQERSYMNDLLLADSEQFEFYQGMIQQKGAPSVFSKLMRSNIASNSSDVQFLEEWAFLLGRFGAPVDPFVTFQLTQTDTRNDPQIIRFAATPNAPLAWIIMPLTDSRWFDKPPSGNFFTPNSGYTNAAFPTAGPVRLSDVAYTVFYISTLGDLYANLVATSPTAPFATGTLTWVYERLDGTYTVLESFETASLPNAILKIQTVNEDDSISPLASRIFFQSPINMTINDVGALLVIDGQTLAQPDLVGIQTITSVNLSFNYVEVNVLGTMGSDFTAFPANAPFVRILREVRFATLDALTAVTYAFNIGDLAWIDNYSNGQWAVVQWDGTTWNVVRNQPLRIDATTISDTVIYAERVTITSQQIIAHDPLVNVVDVIDPLCGLIAGVSELEIDFRTEYDPARYNNGFVTSADTWGAKQVGRVWWNLATVKFLDPYTDIIGASSARDVAELAYRTGNWAQIAPNTSVDVYEWVVSNTDPGDYAGPGTVFLVPAGDPNVVDPTTQDAGYNWVEETIYDPVSGLSSINYYYWVTGLQTIPALPFRQTAIATVAAGIVNPSGLDLSWMAPINTDSLIVSGVLPFLNVDSVMKIKLTLSIDNPGTHDEWILMRPTDETSLPPDKLWFKLQNSLMSYNVFTNSYGILPDPSLAPTRRTGIGLLQNMFEVDGADGSRSGLMDARQAFVESVNNILAQTAVASARQTYIETIQRSSEINQYLLWTQPDISYPYEPPPDNEWDVRVYNLDQRNQLVARSDFLAAVADNQAIRVLVDRIGDPSPYKGWSIWIFDPAFAAIVIQQNPTMDPGLAMLRNADSVFTLAPAYEWSVADETARNLLSLGGSLQNGDRVLVLSDVGGFWAIWRYLPFNNAWDEDVWDDINWDNSPDEFGYVLWRVQTYRLDDFFSNVDWYATGYSASNPPIVTYDTIAQRNAVEGVSPTNLFVMVNDDGTPDHSWVWTAFDITANQWTTVAIQNGTIALSANFYDPTRPVHGVGTISVADIVNRDGTWELYEFAQTLRYGGLLLDSEINTVWFDIVNFCHAQQSDVAWAFKSSFMTIVGYNVPLAQTPFLTPDPTDDLLSYVNEVKPYHTKVREFSTQYSLAPDPANVTATDFDKPVYLDPATGLYRVLDPFVDTTILQTAPWNFWFANYRTMLTPVRGIDITLIFDRYSIFNGWDEMIWDTSQWDNSDPAQTLVYAHTTINANSTDTTIQVDDIRFMQMPLDGSPLRINLGVNSYQIGAVFVDAVNVSITTHGLSGSMTVLSGVFAAGDSMIGNVVEAVLVMPSAASRIAQSYVPTADMPPNDPTLLMDLDMKGLAQNYVTTVANATGDTVLTFANTIGISINQPLLGPNIIKGTVVSQVTGTTITLNTPLTGVIPVGTTISVDLPNWIDGFVLQTFAPPVSEFDIAPFDVDPLDIDTDIYDSSYDGSTLAGANPAFSINPPLPSRPGGFDLRSPYYAINHPQERVPFAADDGLQLTVSANADIGGPPQIIKAFDVSDMTSPATLFYDLIAQSAMAVMVFRDGIRANLTTDYTVDHFNRTVTVDVSNINIVQIHAFGFGATSVIADQNYISFEANPISLEQSSTVANIAVVEAGTLLNGGYTVSGSDVMLATPPDPDTDVAVIVYDDDASTATTMTTQTYAYNVGQQWTLDPRDSDTVPEHAGTIVEVNGKRLTPLTTFYGTFTPETPYMYLPLAPIVTTTIKIYVNGILYTAPVPFSTGTSPSSPYPFDLVVISPPPPNLAGQFVIFGSLLVALDPAFSGDVAMVLDFVNITPDYTVDAGVLTINTALISSDQIEVTVFSNAVTMGLQTVVYTPNGGSGGGGGDSGVEGTWDPATVNIQTGGTIGLDSTHTILSLSGSAVQEGSVKSTPLFSLGPETLFFGFSPATLTNDGQSLQQLGICNAAFDYTHAAAGSDVAGNSLGFTVPGSLDGGVILLKDAPIGTAGQAAVGDTCILAINSSKVWLSIDGGSTWNVGGTGGNPHSDTGGYPTTGLQPGPYFMVAILKTNNGHSLAAQIVPVTSPASLPVVNPTETFFCPVPFAKSYAMVTMNGLALAPDIDYEIIVGEVGWDAVAWDAVPWDIILSEAIADIFNPIDAPIVITVTTASAMREAVQWKVLTNTLAFLRMTPYPNAAQQVFGEASNAATGEFPLFNVSYEYVRQTPYTAGVLTQTLAPTDTQMVIALFLKTLSPKLQEVNPFVDPQAGSSGIVWIGNERIEYFGYSRTDDEVTLSGLRRSTYATSVVEQRSVTSALATGAEQSFRVDVSNGLGPLEVIVDGKPFTEFVATAIGNNVEVVLTAPMNAFVVVAMTNGFAYPVGTTVYNGSDRFSIPVPIGPLVGDREIEPMHRIIAS